MIPVIGFVLLILPCILSRERFITSHGGICTSLCGQHGKSYYWCWQKSYSGSSWDYCSPAERYDYKNKQCKSDCKSDGYSYTWCSLTQGSWGYCGHISEEFETWYTRYNVKCVTDCNKDGRYFQCLDSNDKREYCSPSDDVTIKGEPCRENHPCDSYGKSYTWCYTDENNNWDYCGKINTDCENREYCSPSDDVTIKGKPCRENHPCGSYGESYTWCYTDENNDWDYCEKINTDCEKSVYFSPRKLSACEEEELCRITDTGNRRVTILTAIPETRLSTLNRNQFIEASRVINMITPSTSFRTGTMFTSDTVRLDVQGNFVRDGVRYYNLQVQLNGQRRGQSSVSQALIPEDLEVSRYFRYIRRALQTSLRGAYHGDPVKVFVIIRQIK